MADDVKRTNTEKTWVFVWHKGWSIGAGIWPNDWETGLPWMFEWWRIGPLEIRKMRGSA